MSRIKEKLAEKIHEWRIRTERLLTEYGDVEVDRINISQVIGGMRGVKSLVTDISYLDPQEGIRFRGYTLPEVFKKLPKPRGAEMPYIEGLFYLLLTGDIPKGKEMDEILHEFNKRKRVPQYVFDILDAFPCSSHPMVLFSAAIMSMQRDSQFTKKYHSGIRREDYWDPTYEDAMNLLAKLPELAARIYNKLYRITAVIPPDTSVDMGTNFARMMGKDAPYDEVTRLQMVIHSDHESGNVSAHTGHLVASSLSDVYYAISAMINGLAGPLHGLANQEVLRWIQALMDQHGTARLTEESISKYVWETLNSGQVVPGYGHAVLRKTDPRYAIQREFCLKNIPDDPIFKCVDMLYKVVPPILKEHGKAKNPWPNLDAQSGVIQWHYGVTQYDFYTVLFGMGRAFGIAANIIWDRALGYPLERPKSLTTSMLEKIAEDSRK